MKLAIDVGNTNIVCAVYEMGEMAAFFRLSTKPERTRDEFGMCLLDLLRYNKIDVGAITEVIIASVVPEVMYSLERAVRKYLNCRPLVLRTDMDFGLKIGIDSLNELGIDRIVNAYAAVEKHGAPVIIVDFGTATTFCAVSGEREYLGGAIAPGLKISTNALFEKTAKLPRIELTKPDKYIGRNTVAAMQSGVLHGYVGSTEYIVKMMKEEMGAPQAKVVATGGFAKVIASVTDAIDVIEPYLTLEGIMSLDV